LDEAECLRLISPGGVGRVAFTGRYGPSIFPVNYKVHEGSVPFGEDLRTGIEHADYGVAFEIDHLEPGTREGWSVLIQGPAHHKDTPAERALAEEIGVEPWAGRKRDDAVRITPVRVTGRRIRQAG
jgi:nitroimidazol reductase NimA-like FMN-containing flavoprotein (pyridoxamine 5'-phosphate oxidase superfamily)